MNLSQLLDLLESDHEKHGDYAACLAVFDPDDEDEGVIVLPIQQVVVDEKNGSVNLWSDPLKLESEEELPQMSLAQVWGELQKLAVRHGQLPVFSGVVLAKEEEMFFWLDYPITGMAADHERERLLLAATGPMDFAKGEPGEASEEETGPEA
jgi:hypothetical protein